jgi:hypothetical protein
MFYSHRIHVQIELAYSKIRRLLMDFSSAVLWAGLAGGVSNEVLHWWGLRFDENLPHYARRVFYWLITAIMVVVGGVVAQIQLGSGGVPFIAFQIGLLAPMLLKKIAGSSEDPTGAMGGAQPSLRKFIKG